MNAQRSSEESKKDAELRRERKLLEKATQEAERNIFRKRDRSRDRQDDTKRSKGEEAKDKSEEESEAESGEEEESDETESGEESTDSDGTDQESVASTPDRNGTDDGGDREEEEGDSNTKTNCRARCFRSELLACLREAVQRVDPQAVVAREVVRARSTETLGATEVLVADVVLEGRAVLEVLAVAFAHVLELLIEIVAQLLLAAGLTAGLSTLTALGDAVLLLLILLNHHLANFALFVTGRDFVGRCDELATGYEECKVCKMMIEEDKKQEDGIAKGGEGAEAGGESGGKKKLCNDFDKKFKDMCEGYSKYLQDCPSFEHNICHEDLGGAERLRAPCPDYLTCYYCLRINPLYCLA
jgi:hypothetical protein